MLIKIGNEAYVPKLSKQDQSGLRLVSSNGSERFVDIGNNEGTLYSELKGKLLWSHKEGVSIVDVRSEFSLRELAQFEGDIASHKWTSSFRSALIDSRSNTVLKFEIDYKRLNPLDPGYSIPSGIPMLIPDTCKVIVTLSRDSKFAIFDVAQDEYQFVDLPNGFGGANWVQSDKHFAWIRNYDTFCRMELDTLTITKFNRLQPAIYNEKIGREGSAFIGTPWMSDSLGGWLVPRPYSSDILLVDVESLDPIGKIVTGGRPYSLVEFDDGELLIIDHPFDKLQTSHVDKIEKL